jgi:hypothetical protein
MKLIKVGPYEIINIGEGNLQRCRYERKRNMDTGDMEGNLELSLPIGIGKYTGGLADNLWKKLKDLVEEGDEIASTELTIV